MGHQCTLQLAVAEGKSKTETEKKWSSQNLTLQMISSQIQDREQFVNCALDRRKAIEGCVDKDR